MGSDKLRGFDGRGDKSVTDHAFYVLVIIMILSEATAVPRWHGGLRLIPSLVARTLREAEHLKRLSRKNIQCGNKSVKPLSA